MLNFVRRRTTQIEPNRLNAAMDIREPLAPDAAWSLLFGEGLPPLVIERALRASLSVSRRARRRSGVRIPMEIKQPQLTLERRVDSVTAQRVEVSLVFQLMLGTLAGAEYLQASGVAEGIATRVLGSQIRRASLPLIDT